MLSSIMHQVRGCLKKRCSQEMVYLLGCEEKAQGTPGCLHVGVVRAAEEQVGQLARPRNLLNGLQRRAISSQAQVTIDTESGTGRNTQVLKDITQACCEQGSESSGHMIESYTSGCRLDKAESLQYNINSQMCQCWSLVSNGHLQQGAAVALAAARILRGEEGDLQEARPGTDDGRADRLAVRHQRRQRRGRCAQLRVPLGRLVSIRARRHPPRLEPRQQRDHPEAAKVLVHAAPVSGRSLQTSTRQTPLCARAFDPAAEPGRDDCAPAAPGIRSPK